MISMSCCPDDLDERTELYCLNRLPAAEVDRFEAHLLTCPACLDQVLETDLFLESLITALKEVGRRESYPCS